MAVGWKRDIAVSTNKFPLSGERLLVPGQAAQRPILHRCRPKVEQPVVILFGMLRMPFSIGRCIHFAAHDGEPTNTFSCPTWIRDPDGIGSWLSKASLRTFPMTQASHAAVACRGCKLPRFNWQACPMRFKMMRVDTGIPQDCLMLLRPGPPHPQPNTQVQEFKQALSTPCSAAKEPEAPPVPDHQFPERSLGQISTKGSKGSWILCCSWADGLSQSGTTRAR